MSYVCREGMLKMKDVYVNNPALGDPNALEKKIEENALKIDSLQAEMRKFQVIKQKSIIAYLNWAPIFQCLIMISNICPDIICPTLGPSEVHDSSIVCKIFLGQKSCHYNSV